MKFGISATKTVNGETVPDYAAESTNGTSTIGKMINATVELLKRHGVKGVGGAVGTYDKDLLGNCVQQIYLGAAHADTGYGITVTREYFQTAKLI